MAGSLGEEILFRLFTLSLLLRLLPEGRAGDGNGDRRQRTCLRGSSRTRIRIPFGGWLEVPLVSWVWLIVLNGLLGVAFGQVFCDMELSVQSWHIWEPM
jgi:hypothetical protein